MGPSCHDYIVGIQESEAQFRVIAPTRACGEERNSSGGCAHGPAGSWKGMELTPGDLEQARGGRADQAHHGAARQVLQLGDIGPYEIPTDIEDRLDEDADPVIPRPATATWCCRRSRGAMTSLSASVNWRVVLRCQDLGRRTSPRRNLKHDGVSLNRFEIPKSAGL